MNNTCEIAHIDRDNTHALDTYIDKSEPVIISDYAELWPALRKWSRDFFEHSLGHVPVTYRISASCMHPDLSPGTVDNVRTETGTIASFLHQVSGDIPTSERVKYYLTGDGNTMTILRDGQYNRHLRTLLDDITLPTLITPQDIKVIGFWLSPEGTRSWLHYDSGGVHNLNVQIMGRKRVTLFSPNELHRLYPFPLRSSRAFNFSRVNVEEPDYTKYPLFADAAHMEGVLGPGDCLFLPAFWFHTFKGEGELNSNINFWWASEHPEPSVTALRSALLNYLVPEIQSYARNHDTSNGAPGGIPPEVLGFADRLEQRIASSGRMEFL